MQNQQNSDLLSRFLNSGAFYRVAPDRFRLMCGPWQLSTEGLDWGFQEFFGSDPKGYRAAEVFELNRDELTRFLEPALSGPSQWRRDGFVEPLLSDFETSFQMIQGKIQRGEIEKAVPIVFAKAAARPTEHDVAGGMLKMMALPEQLHAFGFWDGKRGILGATPEILFYRKAMVVQAMALAGSCPKADVDHRLPLLKDPKEMREHELVVNDLIARLKPLGWLKKTETEVVELPTLLHLKTKFEVSGCAKRDFELVRLLHPTPALGVSPRAYGHQWMQEMPEQKDRSVFGAPMLFGLGADETIALVAIRSVLWDEQGSRVGSGCGVVGASELQREWHELAIKRESVYKMMGIE